MTHSHVKLLLIQMRVDPAMQAQERRAICRGGRLQPDQLTVINGLERTVSPDDLKSHHMLFIGGTGDYSVFDTLPVTDGLKRVLTHAKATEFPVIGSCWGGQLMAQAFGGVVETDPEREEVGSYKVYGTAATHTDPLFTDAPAEFWAQIGHHESITQLPEGAVNLLRSERANIQAFTWPESNLYGFQLHCDLNKQELIERITHYRESYAPNPALLNAIIDNAQESPHMDNLIAKFVERIVLPMYH